MVPSVAVPTYQDTYNSLGSVYDPQTQLVQSQLNDLPNQEQTQMSSLDQAKANAFKDITSSANSRGMLFSGYSPDNQAIYTGTKYLPAVANLKTSINNTKNTLLDTINKINAARSNAATSAVNTAQKAADTNAYKNATLAISASKAGGSGGLTQSQLLTQESKYKIAPKIATTSGSSPNYSGGYAFQGPNGQPINMASYLAGSGSSGQDLINLLSGGSSYDKSVLTKASKTPAFQKAVQGEDYGALVAAIKKYDTGNYYGF